MQPPAWTRAQLNKLNLFVKCETNKAKKSKMVKPVIGRKMFTDQKDKKLFIPLQKHELLKQIKQRLSVI